MGPQKYSTVLLFLIFSVCYASNLTTAAPIPVPTPCGDWQIYKDEKCFKVVDDNFRTFDEAEQACVSFDGEPTLAIVHSKEEQDFLANYLFRTLKKEQNFWIGAKNVANKFQWLDGTDVSFNNFDAKSFKNKTGYCVQMEYEETAQGKWVDDPCDQRNLVVCERMQTWSLPMLHRSFLNSRKKLTDELDAANNQIVQLKKENEEANKKITENKHQNEESNKRIAENKQSLIPINFLYVQLPNEKTAQEIWPSMKWAEVSAAYAGVFFRVVGGTALPFGQTQPESSPYIASVETVQIAGPVKPGAHAARRGGASDQIQTGSLGDGKLGIVLHHSTDEVRPRNMAIRVWKRTG